MMCVHHHIRFSTRHRTTAERHTPDFESICGFAPADAPLCGKQQTPRRVVADDKHEDKVEQQSDLCIGQAQGQGQGQGYRSGLSVSKGV